MRKLSLAVAAGLLLLLPLAIATVASAATTRYEAENCTISAGTVDTNHLNYSGTGFVNGDNAAGNYLQCTVTASNAGTATFGIRYANGTTTNRPADISVNGSVVAAAAAFDPTANWDTWATKNITAAVNAGSNTIRIAATTSAGNANLDYVDFSVAAASPVYQAEDAVISQGVVANNHLNYTGTGFVDYTNVTGSYVEFTVSAATTGTYTLTFRHANGSTANRPMSISVNGSTVNSNLAFNPTANWDTWVDVSLSTTLNAGSNTVRATATTANGGPNLDKLTVASGGGGGTPGMAAAPYEYFGWGSPQDPVSVMNATGIKWFTLAFILSDGTCNPTWDGSRPLTGGNDQTQINRIRANGGDIMVSVGGWSGNKLGEFCSSASALAGAYQKVINAYSLKAIDIDIENTEWGNATVRQRVIDALKLVKQNNPGIKTVITFGTTPSGPDATGVDMITRGANSGLANDVWSVMPFDFGSHSGSMGSATVSAVEGLKSVVKSRYGYSDSVTYAHIGLSSMNGKTDEADETVTLADFNTILSYAQQHQIARFAFWSINRDRACGSGLDGDSCSGISQQPYDFTKIVAQYHG
jgi:chitinase